MKLARLVSAVVIAAALVPGLASAAAASTPPTEVLVAAINADRRAQGLAPFGQVDLLDANAEAWTAVMTSRNVLFHNPDRREQLADWADSSEVVGRARLPLSTLEQTVARIHEAFIDSPAHREILRGPYDHVGIAVREASDGAVWVTAVVGAGPPAGAVAPPGPPAPMGHWHPYHLAALREVLR